MFEDVSRRSFIRGTMIGLAGAVTAGLVGCAEGGNGTSTNSTATPEAEKIANETKETDVLVVGIGASGLQAALGAAASGASVIAIDSAANMTGTTNTLTSGYLCVGDDLQLAQPYHYEVKEIFEMINKISNYCFNTQTMKAILEASHRSSNNLINAGVPLKVVELTEHKDLTGPTLGQVCGHAYGSTGKERADKFQTALDKAGVTSIFGITAQSLLWDEEKIAGVRCESEEGITDIKAKAICLCTGGFLGNEEMVAKYYAGSRIVPMGNTACVGSGINMALSANAQIGKAFSISSNEYGGANFIDGKPAFSFRPDSGTNEALRLILLGSILVDAEGNRFISEEIANKEAMHCAEPFIRAKTYYTVVDQDFVDYVSVTPLGQIMGDGRMKKMFAEYTATTLHDDLDKAIAGGWAAKADTIAEVAKTFGLTNLENTVKTYNSYCDAGIDDDFYNAPTYMHKLKTPPFYIVQSYPAGWLSLGGIKSDAAGHALDADNKPVEGLFIAGADADLFCAPYIMGGGANGFAQASGLIAGESAAKYANA